MHTYTYCRLLCVSNCVCLCFVCMWAQDQAKALDHFDDRLKALQNRSVQVLPLKYRRDPPSKLLPVEALCEYDSDKVLYSRGLSYTHPEHTCTHAHRNTTHTHTHTPTCMHAHKLINTHETREQVIVIVSPPYL